MPTMILLLIAALSYSIGGYYMKLSDGLTRGGAAVAVIGLFCLGACLQMIAMRHSEMTVNYIIVLGFEAITALTVGIFFLKEGLSLTRLLGVLIVIIGVALLRQ